MKTKKIILFIVEGPSDEYSLAGILRKINNSEGIKFYAIHGDITQDTYIDELNARNKINELIGKFLKKETGIKRKDIVKIVHLIDTDGVFIDEKYITEESVDRIIYSENGVVANSKDHIIQRNHKKGKVISRLYSCQNINSIPYEMYYFSCNLEHVLHNELKNFSDEEKRDLSFKFAKKFKGKELDFIDFISNNNVAVEGDYRQSWNYIKQNRNSLNRNSNFHLYFKNEEE